MSLANAQTEAFGIKSPESFDCDDDNTQDGDYEEHQCTRQAKHSEDSNRGVVGEDVSAEKENITRDPDACPPPVIATGVVYQVYDSDDEGNTQVRYPSLDKTQRRYDPVLVRKHVRSEFIRPGSSWDASPPLALPQAKAAELFMAFQKWNKRFSDPYFIRNLKAKPLQRLSAYLAAEIVAQLSTGNSVDTLWAAAGVAEEYIRQVLWPKLMMVDAIRIREDEGSEVINLAKTVLPAYVPGFNNDRFWGYAIYMALRFPPGLHPFTTPVVRNALAYLTAAQDKSVSDESNPWMTKDANMDGVEMALAATWAGYHISHHLLTRNAYHYSEAEIQERRKWLDALVAVATRNVSLIRLLFLDTIEGNGYIDTSLSTELLTSQFVEPAKWSSIVGACHRVEYNRTNSLPLPICKPSMVLAHLQEIGVRDQKRLWDESEDFRFGNEYDEPLDPKEHESKESSLKLPDTVAKEVGGINAWLLSFLRGESPAGPWVDGTPARPVLVSLESPRVVMPRAKPSERIRRPGVTTRAITTSVTVDTVKGELAEVKKEVCETKTLVQENAVALEAMRITISQQTLIIESLKTFIAGLVKSEATASVKDIIAAVQRVPAQTGEARRLLSTPAMPTPRYDSPQTGRFEWSQEQLGGLVRRQ